MTLPSDDELTGCYRTLALHVIWLAVKDARKGDLKAMLWLGGSEALELAEALELPRWPPPEANLWRRKPAKRGKESARMPAGIVPR